MKKIFELKCINALLRPTCNSFMAPRGPSPPLWEPPVLGLSNFAALSTLKGYGLQNMVFFSKNIVDENTILCSRLLLVLLLKLQECNLLLGRKKHWHLQITSCRLVSKAKTKLYNINVWWSQWHTVPGVEVIPVVVVVKLVATVREREWNRKSEITAA